jgi:hypothetical protein
MNDKSSIKVSRRDAVKILTAVAGATALANIPSKWTKPSLDIGILPAHAQTSGVHTLAVGPDQNVDYCSPANLVSTVTISPGASGIPMKYTIVASTNVTISSPASPTGTALTNSSGVASVTVNASTFDVNPTTVEVTWEFANPSEGTGNGTQVFTNLGC